MFCSPWDCQWKAPDRRFVFRLADGRLRKKLLMLPMHLSESRSERKKPANMPSLRQLEFAFRSTDIAVGPPGASPGELIIEPAGKGLLAIQSRRLCYCKQTVANSCVR